MGWTCDYICAVRLERGDSATKIALDDQYRDSTADLDDSVKAVPVQRDRAELRALDSRSQNAACLRKRQSSQAAGVRRRLLSLTMRGHVAANATQQDGNNKQDNNGSHCGYRFQK